MNWDQKIIDSQELRAYQGDPADVSLETRVAALIDQQCETWQSLREGYDAFAQVETKQVQVNEAEVVIQYNPRRIRSTSASVDKTAIDNRRCFLCPEDLPKEEKGIAYGGDLVVLCSPFPILDRHLSIVHREHRPQQIEGNLDVLLSLARDLGTSYFVLYNGPECGASAPDHLHFQACSRELLPIEQKLFEDEPVMAEDCAYCEETARNSFELFTLGGIGRSVVVFRGGNRDELAQWIYNVIDELAQHTGRSEPLLNVICTYDPKLWTVYLFPRAKHRPACFYASGEERLIVSPGAIDMAGVVVVPERQHYDRIDAERVAQVFSEVSLRVDLVNDLIDEICALPDGE